MLYPRISPADKPRRDIPQVAENSPLSFCSTHVFCGLSGTTHFSYSSVNCYLKQCWKKNFYPSFIAVMWSKDTTCCSCSSFLLSFKILFPDIQSNIFWQRPGLCTSVNNFIYFFLWSWAGGILKILQSYWFRELAVFYFIQRPWMVLGKTVPFVLVFCCLWRAIWNDSMRFSILDSRRTRTPLYFC